MTSNELTDRQQDALDCIRWYIEDSGRPPSVREIGDWLGGININAVVYHLKALERYGYVIRDAKVSRGLRLTNKANPERGMPLLDMADLNQARTG